MIRELENARIESLGPAHRPLTWTRGGRSPNQDEEKKGTVGPKGGLSVDNGSREMLIDGCNHLFLNTGLHSLIRCQICRFVSYTAIKEG